jgi:hypothetical protein
MRLSTLLSVVVVAAAFASTAVAVVLAATDLLCRGNSRGVVRLPSLWRFSYLALLTL